jgi:SAM-dependent methyltransferase
MTGTADDDGQDVPSPIDLRDPGVAADWVAAADRKRPWRAGIREAIATLLQASSPAPRRVLELGAGPGLLAEAILRVCSLDDYTLLDFSPPMLEMSRARLAAHPSAAFVCGDFKLAGWTEVVPGPFDAVVTMQAVHELRHKRHAPGLYRRVRDVLRPGGVLVVCDHNPPDDSARATALNSTEAEQHSALRTAGFVEVRTQLVVNGLYVCTGRAPARVE